VQSVRNCEKGVEKWKIGDLEKITEEEKINKK
jgi:hypothetical protein